MKTIMILGAGKGQLPFIQLCKKRGYKVIVVSIKGEYPGFKIADKSYYIDTRDKEKILEIAKKERIDAIYTDQTDVSVPSVAYVAEKLALKGIGYETSLKFTNKYLMRKAAKEVGIRVPEFDHAFNLEEAIAIAKKIGFPIIIKPVDSSGSRGVIRVESFDILKKVFSESQKYSINKEVILEKIINGPEYIVDGMAMNNEYINLDLGTKEYFEKDDLYMSKMCMFTSAHKISDRTEKKVLDTNAKLVEAMKLNFGLTIAEYIYNQEEDEVYLVEVAARGGGVFLSSDLTPLATGIYGNEILVDYLLENKNTQIRKLKLEDKVSAWMCFTFPEGEIVSIQGEKEIQNIKGVYKTFLDNIYIGKKTVELKDDTDKYGPILLMANSREECFKIINEVKKTLHIKVKTIDGIKDMIW